MAEEGSYELDIIDWPSFCKAYAKLHKITYGQALVEASGGWTIFKQQYSTQIQNQQIRQKIARTKEKQRQLEAEMNGFVGGGGGNKNIPVPGSKKTKKKQPTTQLSGVKRSAPPLQEESGRKIKKIQKSKKIAPAAPTAFMTRPAPSPAVQQFAQQMKALHPPQKKKKKSPSPPQQQDGGGGVLKKKKQSLATVSSGDEFKQWMSDSQVKLRRLKKDAEALHQSSSGDEEEDESMEGVTDQMEEESSDDDEESSGDEEEEEGRGGGRNGDIL